MEALACVLMIGVLAVVLLVRPARRGREPDAAVEQLRREVAELREQRGDGEPRP